MSGSTLYGPFGLVGGNSGIEYALLTNTTQNNLNNTPIQWRNVTFNAGSLVTNIPALTANGTGFTNVPVGVYYIYGSILYTSAIFRTNLRVRVNVNTAPLLPEGAGGYIRAANNNNTASVHVAGIYQIGTISTIGLSAAQEGNTGTVTTTANLGQIGMLRLS